MVYKISLFFILFVFTLFPLHAQDDGSRLITTRAVVYQGDTIPHIELQSVVVLAPRVFKNRIEERRYNRLVRNVKRVYPYARLAGLKFEEYSRQLEEIENESQRRRVARRLEDEIKDEFEGELRKLTFTQGHILIKLIDRETKHTSYDLLRDFRGAFTAVFWQSLGRIFGYNLRTEYDPYGEDKDIEEIVRLLEEGLI